MQSLTEIRSVHLFAVEKRLEEKEAEKKAASLAEPPPATPPPPPEPEKEKETHQQRDPSKTAPAKGKPQSGD